MGRGAPLGRWQVGNAFYGFKLFLLLKETCIYITGITYKCIHEFIYICTCTYMYVCSYIYKYFIYTFYGFKLFLLLKGTLCIYTTGIVSKCTHEFIYIY